MWCSTAEAGDKVWVLRENVYDENSPEHVHTLKQIQEKGQELHGEIRQVQPRWDRKTRTFTVDTPVPQLEGNAERWSRVGPRKMETHCRTAPAMRTDPVKGSNAGQ